MSGRDPPQRSGPTPAPLTQSDIGPMPQMGGMGGAPMGSSDFSLATFLNEVSSFVPPSIARNLWGYCLEENEWVYTPKGAIRANEIVEGQAILGGAVVGVNVFEDDIYELRTRNLALRIKSNGEHPFQVKHRATGIIEWKSAKELVALSRNHSHKTRLDIRLGSPDSFNFDSALKVGIPTARLLGYIFSDGTWSDDSTISVTNSDPRIIDDIKHTAQALGFRTSEFKVTPKGFPNSKPSTYIHICEYESGLRKVQTLQFSLRALMRSLGAWSKTSFAGIQSLPREELIQFVNGFFMGDGSINDNGVTTNGTRNSYIAFSVGPKERLACEFQFILWRLGVNSYVVQVHGANCYEVRVRRVQDILKLCQFLEDKKYPERFKQLIEYALSASHHKKNVDEEGSEWIPIASVVRIGRGKVVSWETTPSHLIIGRLGAYTHNCNRLTAVGKFDPRQASAEIDRVNAMAVLLKMSVPKRKVTSKFLLDLENFIDFTKKQVYRASIPRNERELLATSVSEVVSQPRSVRRKFLGFV